MGFKKTYLKESDSPYFIAEISKSLIVCLKNTSLSITIGNEYSDLESALNCGVNYADLFVDNDEYNVYIPNNIK